MPYKFLPCQLKKKHVHSILILYLCKVFVIKKLPVKTQI